MPALKTPPSANGCHGESSGVMVGANIDKSGVASQVINAIGISSRHFGVWEIMPADFAGGLGGKPLPPRVIVVANQFLLLGVD